MATPRSGLPAPAQATVPHWTGRSPTTCLRDYFGAHTYRRTDREGSFHTRWGQDGGEVRTDA